MTPIVPPPLDPHTMALIRLAVREDMGHETYGTVQGDKTVDLAIPQELRGTGVIVPRKPGVIAGTYLLEPILREYQVGMECAVHTPDGTRIAPGGPHEKVATISGSVRTLLSAERVMLNFLGHLSGIATLTRAYVDAVANAIPEEKKRPVICDTRKTTPAWRTLDKYAVRCGGGVNHRMALYSGVMLKDNHLAALRERLGSGLTLAQLTARIRAELDKSITLWLEVDTLEQLKEALGGGNDQGRGGGTGGADIIEVDNFSVEEMKEAVAIRDDLAKDVLLEASGGITLENLQEIARTGIDRISIGAITHSAPVLDLSMEFQ